MRLSTHTAKGFLQSWILRPPRKKGDMSISPQQFDYFLVLDFEATCERDTKLRPQEIIEFPCLKVSGKTFEVESTFHRYVRPVTHPLLSIFCTELTGITQDAVASEDAFEKVFIDFNAWLAAESVIGSRFTFVTSGDWDLKTMLPNQCADVGAAVPGYCGRWINLKVAYHRATGLGNARSLGAAISGVGLQFEGQPHSGIDDSANIARVLKKLAETGYVFENTFVTR